MGDEAEHRKSPTTYLLGRYVAHSSLTEQDGRGEARLPSYTGQYLLRFSLSQSTGPSEFAFTFRLDFIAIRSWNMSTNDKVTSTSSFDKGFSQYAAYVHALAQVNPQFLWLSAFFSDDSPQYNPDTRIEVVESENGKLLDRPFSPDILLKGPRPGTTRLVIFSYREILELDREMLGGISMALNLPPYFLWRHFDYANHHRFERTSPDLAPIPLIPTEAPSIEIGYTSFLHLSGMLVCPGSADTGAVGNLL
jgi:hypothetical protein